MAGGSALSTFNDFMTATDSAILTSADTIVNEAVRQNYLLRRFLKGRGPQEILQGGKTIKDQIFFEEDSTFEYYQPNETFTWSNPQVLSEWEINWRFCVDHMSWTDHEIELNAGGGLGRNARHAVYKRLRRVKEMRLWTSLLNGIEDSLFAVPDTSLMEQETGTKPYSIPCFVNERLDGKFDESDGTTWTTVQNINSTDAGKTKWKPQVTLYDTSAHTDTTTGILAAFDDMYLSVKFSAPPTRQEYFESDTLYRQFIACSKLGLTTYTQLMRAENDRLVTPGMQDPAYLKPTYGGIELEYVSALDTAALYEQHTGNALMKEAESDGTPAGPYADGGDAGDAKFLGPRYYWLNANYLKPVFHNKRYMHRHPVLTHPNQPFTHVQPIDCWMNMVCTSRHRQGMVSPGATYAGAGTGTLT
tara:strand:+ start:7930 stop:9180 length:1251 start_codon:yes stop_codon:yes gene_type:complete